MIKQDNYILKVIFNVFLLVFLHNRMTLVRPGLNPGTWSLLT